MRKQKLNYKNNHHFNVQDASRISMIIVSHDASYIRQHCNNAVVLTNGILRSFDYVDEAYEYYMENIVQ